MAGKITEIPLVEVAELAELSPEAFFSGNFFSGTFFSTRAFSTGLAAALGRGSGLDFA